MTRGVFDGVKVVDFTWIAAGPLVTKYLGDQGAKVVRIESCKRLDMLRTSTPYKDKVPGIDRSGSFTYVNPNKYSMALDLNHPRAPEVLEKLVAWADIVAENFAAGTMERRGLGYEDLKKINPGIIMFRSSNQGQTGPHAKHSGFGAQLVGLSGFVSLVGWPDREVVQPYGAYTDFFSFCFGAIMLIAALDYRRKTGRGQCLDLSQYETSAHFLAPLLLDYTLNGRESTKMGNACPYAAPHEVYRCLGEDRWCAISVFTDDEWQAFCQVIGSPKWTKESRFATLLRRKENEGELNRLVEEWTVNFSAEEVMRRMQDGGVAAGVAQNPADVYQDPQLNLRNTFYDLEVSNVGSFPHLGQLFELSRTPPEMRMAAPCFGEHTEYVCRELLGMTQPDFDELLVAGVFS